MNLTDAMTYVRLVLTAVITGLTALYSIYPHDTWIMAVVGVAATLGIHAVPSVSQSNPNPVVPKETDHVG